MDIEKNEKVDIGNGSSGEVFGFHEDKVSLRFRDNKNRRITIFVKIKDLIRDKNGALVLINNTIIND